MKVFSLLVACLVLCLAPAWLLDLLLATNLALAVGAVLLAMRTERPARARNFPGLILGITLSRFGLGLAVTRLLCCGGNPGRLIPAFGLAVMPGNLWLAALLCLLLLVVQVMVVPRGVEQVAQVCARYTMDEMPGRQMAVDADLCSGVLDEEAARALRREIEGSADFYSGLDGLGLFVRADSSIAVLLMLINLMKSGLLLCLGYAVITTLSGGLTSLAIGLMITRAAVQGNLGMEFSQSRISGSFLIGAAGVIFAVELVRLCGAAALPALPFFVLTGTLHLGLKALRGQRRALVEALLCWGDTNGSIVLEVKRGEVQPLLEQIPALRRELAEELGMLLPGVRIKLCRGPYRIQLLGREHIGLSGQPSIARLRELAYQHAAQLVNPEQLLSQVGPRDLPSARVHQVLRNLLRQGISIRKLDFILDCMAQRPQLEADPATEWVRLNLSRLRYRQVTGVLQVVLLNSLDEAALDQLRDGEVLLTSARLRPQWRQLTLARFPRLQVVTLDELTGTAVSFRRLAA